MPLPLMELKEKLKPQLELLLRANDCKFSTMTILFKAC